ncbi:Ataxin-1 and HBP1 module [Dictyocaulus viviparus]|uniref:Ataxin-1 and HBP1 module n=1 Tax=Dictyocaulus viviparus TaxID=29172 RepID=A0A0D8Y629_DICVI|nr:Ataxin-1 and HBP1 module [Dictyocaulus viviparus]
MYNNIGGFVTVKGASATLEPQLEHPFFVLGKGWCSCDPVRTADTYGLECKELKVGDVCISLSRRSNDDAKQLDETVTLAEAAEFKNKEATKAAIREQLTKEMSESDGRSSAPPTRYHPYSKKMRKELKLEFSKVKENNR